MASDEELALLYIDLVFTWGFSVKSPFVSAAQLSTLLPPPSTLIGALSYGLAKTLRWPECELSIDSRMVSGARRVVHLIRSAHLGLKGEGGTYPMGWTDISRAHALPFLQARYRKPEARSTWFGIHGFGKMLMPNARGRLAFVVDSNIAEKELGENWQELLMMAAGSVISIGSKEGLVAVDNVHIENARPEVKRAKTSYYFPRESVTYCDPTVSELEQAEFWSFDMNSFHWFSARGRRTRSKDRYSLSIKQFILPILKGSKRPTQVDVQISPQGIAITTDEGDPWKTVVGNRSWYYCTSQLFK